MPRQALALAGEEPVADAAAIIGRSNVAKEGGTFSASRPMGLVGLKYGASLSPAMSAGRCAWRVNQ